MKKRLKTLAVQLLTGVINICRRIDSWTWSRYEKRHGLSKTIEDLGRPTHLEWEK